jgi:phosphomannomutase
MREKPMVSVAGIRGTLNGSLYPDEFFRYAQAFATLVDGGRVVVGSDARPSRQVLRRIVFGALTSAGCQVLDCGVVPTPTVGLLVNARRAAGGIAITASHNPLEWNALKFFNARGQFLTAAANKKLLRIYDRREFRRAPVELLGHVREEPRALDMHLDRILKHVDVRKIKARKLNVVVDLCNGAGAEIVPRLLERLGVEAQLLHAASAKAFQRGAEPLPQHLGRLCRAVKRTGADAGLALDPDADRLALVDDAGRAIGEERTLTLIADHYLQRTKSPLVVNLSTTRAIDDVARAHGVRVHRTPVGEAHVVDKMIRVKSRLGGEGNGGVICSAIHLGRDAQTGIALLCHALAERKCTLSQLNASVPDYVMLKEKMPLKGHDVKALLARIAKHFQGHGRKNTRDGLRIDFADSWLHVRPSGTEPIIRAFVEAPQKEQASELVTELQGLIR